MTAQPYGQAIYTPPGGTTSPTADLSNSEGTSVKYGSSLTKTEPYGTESIPDAERHGHPRSQFTLWFAANMVLAVLVSGFFASSLGLSIAQGLSAVAVGSLAGALVMGVLASIGTRFGVPQQVQARGPM